MIAETKKILPVILSGGVGSRLWPLSREQHPKPFIKLADGESLLQKPINDLLNLLFGEILTVTNRDLFFYSKDEYDNMALKGLNNTFLLEPIGRDSTAPCCCGAIRNQGTRRLLAAYFAIRSFDRKPKSDVQSC